MFKKLLIWCQGRNTFFAIIELTIGTIMAWFGHLSMEYVALVGTIQGMILGHSVKEDYFANKSQSNQVTDVNGDSNGATK